MDSNIIYLNNNYKITRFICETHNEFTSRLKYIKKIELDNIKFKEALRLSKIWYCIKYKNCKYSYDIYNSVMLYDK
jgi:methionine synthase II (cobalamin-independent)